MDICASAQEPITTDLRRKMDTLGWYDEDGNIVYTTGGRPASEMACLVINSKTFGELCDAIDAVQANLERENDALRHERDEGLMELPLDADGEPIRVGDELEGYGRTIEVVELRYGRSGWVVISRDGNAYADNHAFAHHTPDTWERIIEDARTCTGSAGNYTSVPSMRWTSEVDALVARCRALAGEAS